MQRWTASDGQQVMEHEHEYRGVKDREHFRGYPECFRTSPRIIG